MQFDDLNTDAMDVTELLVATADHGDPGLEPCVQEVLSLVRAKMNLEAVFVRASRPDGKRNGRDQWTAQTDLKLLRSTAMLVGQKFDQGRRPRLPERARWGELRAAAGARPRFEG